MLSLRVMPDVIAMRLRGRREKQKSYSSAM
jgi:hypothetical protein